MNGRKRKSWEETAIKLAFEIAKCRSEDPYIQVGACAIYKDGFRVNLGYNGAPSGYEIDWSDRNERRKRVLHSEANVLNYIKPNEVLILGVTHLPCSECMKLIRQKKIPKIVYSKLMEGYDNKLAFQLAKEFGIEVQQIDYENLNCK